MYPGYWLNPQILAIDKHQARPLHPGSAWAAWAEPPGPMDLSGVFSPRRLLNEFKTREERGASVGAGYSGGALGRSVSGLSRKGGPARSFSDPGSSPVARKRDQVAIKSQPMMGLFRWAPVVLKPLASTLPGAISSQKATAQAPRPPPSGQRPVKAPQCLLVHRTSSAPALIVV